MRWRSPPRPGKASTRCSRALVRRLPPPGGDRGAPLKALLVDSWYDPYLGVVVLVRVRDGELRKGRKLRFMAAGTAHRVDRVGVFTPKPVLVDSLGPGEVGFLTAAIKTVADTRVGDTVTDDARPAAEALPGFKPSAPVVFLRPVPRRPRRLRAPAREPLQTPAQRRQFRARAGELGGARPRLPLRLSRPPAPGDRAGAAGARSSASTS